jgi:hypothetical protein
MESHDEVHGNCPGKALRASRRNALEMVSVVGLVTDHSGEYPSLTVAPPTARQIGVVKELVSRWVLQA